MRVVVEDSESQAWYNMPWCKKTNADLIDRRTRDHLLILRSRTDNLASEWSEPRLAKDIVQSTIRTDRYVKMNRDAGRILAEKKSRSIQEHPC